MADDTLAPDVFTLPPHLDRAPLAVIGSGSWGTALTKILTDNGHQVLWWVHRQEDADYIRAYGHNPRYLADVSLPMGQVRVYDSLEQCLSGPLEGVVLAVPSAFLADVLGKLPTGALQNVPVLSGVKGILPGQSKLITDYLEQDLSLDPGMLAVLAGPCHAEEVAQEKISYLTIGARDQALAERISAWLANRYIRTKASADLEALEYTAILKNVVAIACGMAHGLGYGDNFQAVLVSSALAEIERFLSLRHPWEARQMSATAYTGDVLVTCYSPLSRNRTFGTMIGRGYSVAAAQLEMNMIAEGYYASASVRPIYLEAGAPMHVAEAVYQILYGRRKAKAVFEELCDQLG